MTTLNLDRGGVNVDEQIASDVFYGMRLDPITGALTVEIIAQGNGIVRLPDPYSQSANDYRQWLWTPASLDFSISPTGHLLLTVQ